MKRLATAEAVVPLPNDDLLNDQSPIPTALSEMAESNLAALPSADVLCVRMLAPRMVASVTACCVLLTLHCVTFRIHAYRQQSMRILYRCA
jgi:hypothetical protein